MFAILISEENRAKIEADQVDYPEGWSKLHFPSYLDSHANWYYVRGYSIAWGEPNWAAFPEHIFNERFEFDPDKIKMDWDQVVRKNKENDNVWPGC